MAVALNQSKLIVVMPAYNAAKTLRITYDVIPKDGVYQVIHFDDDSRNLSKGVFDKMKQSFCLLVKCVGVSTVTRTCWSPC